MKNKSTEELIEELIELARTCSVQDDMPDIIFHKVFDIKQELIKRTNEIEEVKKELSWYKDYADRLVNHKDMICLPADLTNLRETNLKLTIENENLKKLITSKWYK